MTDKYLRVGEQVHKRLQAGHAEKIGRTGRVISLREFTEEVIEAGLKVAKKRKK